MAKILVAMSGGVDSAVAVKLLLDEGHEVAGVTFTVENSPESEAAVRDAGLAAASYGIPHTALDLSREFSISQSTLERIFRNSLTLSPREYIILRRIRRS